MSRRRETMGTAKRNRHPYEKYGERIDGKPTHVEPPTDKQRRTLKAHNLPVPKSKSGASSIISALAANGWKVDKRIRQIACGSKRRKRNKSRTTEPKSGMSKHGHNCCCRTKKGEPCPINADRKRDGKWYCHVHDPRGIYQTQRRRGTAGKPGAGHDELDADMDARLSRAE